MSLTQLFSVCDKLRLILRVCLGAIVKGLYLPCNHGCSSLCRENIKVPNDVELLLAFYFHVVIQAHPINLMNCRNE